VAGAARAAAEADGGAWDWRRLAELWRAKQLEYSWIRALTGAHADFGVVTADALDHAMAALGHDAPRLRARLLALYDRLPAYPEVPGALDALAARGVAAAILSNGSPAMLAAAIGAAGLEGRFAAVLSVEAAGVFKPDRRVYDLVTARFGGAPADFLFVSSNGWDAAAAAGYGFRTLWVNRAGAPVDRLPWRPGHVAESLAAAPALADAP
jgi:2-haloacid dehalogenase